MHTEIITKDLDEVVKAIEVDKVVAFPTGTVYGLAVNALSTSALDTLRIIKKRPNEKTFTVFLSDSKVPDFFELSHKEDSFLKKAKNLPLTILLRPNPMLWHLAKDGLVGLRIIDNFLMHELAESVPYPLTATSANISGHEPCLSPQDVKDNLPGVSFILGDQKLEKSTASTILRLFNGEIRIIREGSIDKEALLDLI